MHKCIKCCSTFNHIKLTNCFTLVSHSYHEGLFFQHCNFMFISTNISLLVLNSNCQKCESINPVPKQSAAHLLKGYTEAFPRIGFTQFMLHMMLLLFTNILGIQLNADEFTANTNNFSINILSKPRNSISFSSKTFSDIFISYP